MYDGNAPLHKEIFSNMENSIIIFFALSFLSWLSTRNRALLMIKEISSNSKYYPKWYTLPAKWIRKNFKLNDRFIPKYLYFELIISLVYIALGPINLVIAIATSFSPTVVKILVLHHSAWIALSTINFVIMSIIMKKR